MDSQAVDIHAISMLSPATLTRLTDAARQTQGGIVELGAYVGGSTIALARGNQRRFPHAVIECGGSHDHATRGSNNILADWASNVERFGFADAVSLCRGWGYDPVVQAEAIAHASPIGLLFMDADGFISPPLRAFAPYMMNDCLLVLDDYLAPGAEDKAALVKPFVDRHVEAGRLIPIVVEGGTWFGRVDGQRALTHFAAMAPVRRERGHCFLTPVANARICDTLQHPSRSRLRLFENGSEFGSPHTAHDDIRACGGGGFSHWDAGDLRWLLWSTTDNTDPLTNGRAYEADWGEGRRGLHEI